MKKTLTPTSLVVTWSDGKTEDLVKVLPEYLQDELRIYLAELEDLREEHDAGLRDEPYTFEELFNEHTKGETSENQEIDLDGGVSAINEQQEEIEE